MSEIHEHSIDMILTDLPYGEQRVPWDQPIDLPALWCQYRRIIRPNCPIILFAAQPFTSRLAVSQIGLCKYAMVWIKNRAANFVHANNRPLNFHEDILVFSEGAIAPESRSKRKMPFYPEGVSTRPENNPTGYPRSIVEFAADTGEHPTQKPVRLLSYLIELFSRPGETVLDSCMGSGSTGVAALSYWPQLHRHREA
jgi:site-specific DNA-methyltransferase (adenine-specific)